MAVNLPLTPEQQRLALEDQQSKQVIERLKLFRDKKDTAPFLIPNLISLNLKDKQLRPEEIKWLAESLKLHPTLQNLDLSSAVRPDGEKGKGKRKGKEASTLTESLNQFVVVSNNSRGNLIGDEGVRLLCDALKDHKALKALNLEKTAIKDAGVQAMSEFLKRDTVTLEELNLGGNPFEKAGVGYLAEALKQNTSLRVLDLMQCPNFGKTECQLLLEVLKNHNCFLQALPILDTPASDIDGLDAEVAFCLRLAERLHRTIELGRVGQLRTILDREKGADINDASNKEWGTPLHHSVKKGNLEIVQILLAYGGDQGILHDGKRLVDIAEGKIKQELLAASLDSIKILILGHGRVGKTSAVTAVKNLKKTAGKVKVEENKIEHIHSTIGLDCSSLDIPTEKKEVILPTRIWDFAGQLEYLPCHRHFLSSRRTIFVVMVNTSKSLPKQRKDITYWLNFIKKGVASRDKEGTYREERLLLVVGTKIDLLDTEVIQVPDLLKQYRELVNLFEEPGKEKVFNIGALQSLAISVTLPNTIQALQDELYGMVRSLSNLEKTEGDRFILRKAASLLGELQEDRELVVRRQVDLETTTKDGVKIDHTEALECLHNAGELAFLDSVGWVCLEPTLLEQCSGLFVGPLGHQAELKSEFENNKHTSVMKKDVAIGVIWKFLKSEATKPVKEIVATSVLEVFLAIKLCFESEDEEGKHVIFPSEFGKGETFTLPPSRNAGNKCQRAILTKITTSNSGDKDEVVEFEIEQFQRVMEVVWKFRHKSYRVFVDGLLILPPSVYLTQQGEDSPSLVLLHLSNEGQILLTSHSSEAIDEILTLLLTSDFEESKGIRVERSEVEKKSPIISTLEEKNWHFSKENLLSSVDLAHLLADSSNFKLGSTSPTPLPEDFTVIQKDKDEFHCVLLDEKDSIQKEESKKVKKMFYDFLARGFVHFDFEVEKIVVIFNKERQKRFEQKLQQFSWEDRGRTANSKEKDLLNVETDQGRQRQRTLASFEEYVAKIPGSERTNLVMAWHAHERKNLYSNAVNGHFIPPPVAPDLIEAIKAGTTGPPKVDVGYFGRGAYFAQTPQYVIPYVRGGKDGFVFQLSWILPGKIYPVIEPVKGPGTLHGQGLVEGFDSHYILTDGTVPIPLNKRPTGDELVIYDSDQVLPRYLLFLKKSNTAKTYWGGNIVGVGAIPLPPGPLVIWVDEKEPEFWPDILERQKKPKEGLEVQLHHFRSTGEVLAWMGRNQESLRGKAAKKNLRIASSSKRDEADGEYAGKKLYKMIRKEEHYKAIPFLVYCAKTEMAGFQENETDADPYLRLTSEPYEMVSFGCLRPLLWLKDPHSEWQEVKGPGIYLRLIEVVAFDPALLKGKEWYSAVVSKSDIPTKKLRKNPSLVSFQTEMKEGGKWDWFSPCFPLDEMVKLTVFRYRPIVWDAVMGFVTISVEELNRIGTKESKEMEVTLQNEPGVVSKWPQPKLKLKVMRLEASTDFALAYF